MSMKKTWSIILKMIIAVAGAIAGVIGVQGANL
ncbi:smalltalk protein [Bacteroides caecimuris]